MKATVDMAREPPGEVLVLGRDERGFVQGTTAAGSFLAFSRHAPDRESVKENEDAAMVVPRDDRIIAAVADGVGGIAGGSLASRTAVKALAQSVGSNADADSRDAILEGFDRAHHALADKADAGETTLAVAELRGAMLRTYNVGDSMAMVVGGRGRIKQQSVAHSPVGYGVAAGLIDEADALHHDDLHLITHTVGGQMRIDIGPTIRLAPRDTVVLGTDGLFDNVHLEEVAGIVRKGPLSAAAEALVTLALQRMAGETEGTPSKPDDISFVLLRPAIVK